MGSDREGIVILGCPRSGTTLLRRLLDVHPNIAAPGETYLLTACARFLQSERTADGMDVGVLSGLSFSGFAREEVVARLREFAFGFRREHAVREGKKKWAEKTAIDGFYIDTIRWLCGDHVKFICITRHGLDVACSMMDWCEKSQLYFGELHSYIRKYPRPLEAFSHAWRDIQGALRRLLSEDPENAIAVRYEDLVANTDMEMSRILSKLGETWTPTMLATALREKSSKGFSDWKTFGKATVDDGSIGRWRRLSRTTIIDLAAIVNPTLRDFGYDEIETDLTETVTAAQRRYELGLLFQTMKRGQNPSSGS